MSQHHLPHRWALLLPESPLDATPSLFGVGLTRIQTRPSLLSCGGLARYIYIGLTRYIYIYTYIWYIYIHRVSQESLCDVAYMSQQHLLHRWGPLCSADGSTHTESNKLYRKVKHRYRPNLSPRQRPTAKARPEQAALAASAGAGSHTPSTASESFSRPTEKFVLPKSPFKWHVRDMVLLLVVCARINRSFILPASPVLPTLLQYCCTAIC